MKRASIIGKLGVLALMGFSTAGLTSVASATTLNFGDSTINAQSGTVDATSYLAGFGITESNVTTGAAPSIQDDRFIYSGTAEVATSLHNILQGQGSNTQTNSYELDFAAPIQNLNFYRVALLAGQNGIAYPGWSATLYNGAAQIGSVGEVLSAYFSDQAAAQFSIPGVGNRLVITGNNQNFAAFQSVGIDDLSYTAVPEPTTIGLLSVGACGFLARRRRR